jgi:hypothetical protein
MRSRHFQNDGARSIPDFSRSRFRSEWEKFPKMPEKQKKKRVARNYGAFELNSVIIFT